MLPISLKIVYFKPFLKALTHVSVRSKKAKIKEKRSLFPCVVAIETSNMQLKNNEDQNRFLPKNKRKSSIKKLFSFFLAFSVL